MKEIEDRTNFHEVHDVALYLNGRQIKSFRTIFFEGMDKDESIKKKALSWYGFEYNEQYDEVRTVFLKNEGIKQNNIKSEKMAKATEKTIDITPAQGEEKKAEGTALVKFEEKAKGLALPTIPAEIEIGGVKFSTESIQKKVDEVKKIVLADKTDEKTYAILKKKKIEFQKTRTGPETFRTNITKPINAWTKELKMRTDSYGALAQKGEAHCDEQIKIYEDWEAEQLKIKQEAEEKLVNGRIVELQAVLGIRNPDSLHWTFNHNPVYLEHEDLLEKTEEEWTEIIEGLQATHQAELDKIESDRLALIEAKKSVNNTRIQMLVLLQYTEANGVYSKNGHSIKGDDIGNYTDEQWLPLIQSHNEPKVAVNPFQTEPVVTTQPAQSSGSRSFPNPFASALSNKSEEPAPLVEPAQIIQTLDAGLSTQWTDELPFLEFNLSKQTLRLYPLENESAALNIPNRDDRVTYRGQGENQLCYVMFKNS